MLIEVTGSVASLFPLRCCIWRFVLEYCDHWVCCYYVFLYRRKTFFGRRCNPFFVVCTSSIKFIYIPQQEHATDFHNITSFIPLCLLYTYEPLFLEIIRVTFHKKMGHFPCILPTKKDMSAKKKEKRKHIDSHNFIT